MIAHLLAASPVSRRHGQDARPSEEEDATNKFIATACALVLLSMAVVASPALALQQVADWPQVSLEPFVGGLSQPTYVTHAGDGSGRLFVVEQAGRIRIIKNGALLPAPFLDIGARISCCGERGLLSVAFPPGYATKGYFYVYYTDAQGDITMSRFRTGASPDQADAASEQVLLKIGHREFGNHNGGLLAFGPDGLLYIGTGDGGGGGDTLNNGQNRASLLGKLLRIDTESGVAPYAIPSTNPFAVTPGLRGEIWAWGLRNPWRFSFDRQTRDLYIADVGQDLFEEVDFQPAASQGGENYGWNIMEGLHCFQAATCDQTGLTLPVVEYDHSLGCSITGGFVYRGAEFPTMRGVYFYSDFCSGRLWGLRRSGSTWQSKLLAETGLSVSTFGEDEAGRLYLADYATGTLYRLLGPAAADLTLDLAQTPDSVAVGAPLTYIVTITNRGPQAASGVTLSGRLPNGVALVSATPSQGTCGPNASCNLGGLPVGASATVRVIVTPGQPGRLRSIATVTAGELDPDRSSNWVAAAVSVIP